MKSVIFECSKCKRKESYAHDYLAPMATGSSVTMTCIQCGSLEQFTQSEFQSSINGGRLANGRQVSRAKGAQEAAALQQRPGSTHLPASNAYSASSPHPAHQRYLQALREGDWCANYWKEQADAESERERIRALTPPGKAPWS